MIRQELYYIWWCIVVAYRHIIAVIKVKVVKK